MCVCVCMTERVRLLITAAGTEWKPDENEKTNLCDSTYLLRDVDGVVSDYSNLNEFSFR